MPYIVVVGRVLFSALFILASLSHFSSGAIGYAASQGVPFASFLVPVSGLLSLFGGLSILLGYKAKKGAWLLVIFLIPVTFMMHPFWGLTDPMTAGIQKAMFMKNLSMLGAALLITHFGSGPMSLSKK